MSTFNDFEVVLSNIEDLKDAFYLDQTIRTGTDNGFYHYNSDGERIFITSDCFEGTFMLPSEKAKNYFLDKLEKRWSEEGIPLEIYYAMRSQMDKDD